MRTRFSILGALIAALCMSLVSVAGASAQEFEGKPVGAKLAAEALGTQTFEAGGPTEGLKVKCTKLEVTSGEVVSAKASSQAATVVYKECEESAGNLAVKPIKVNFLFFANGKVEVQEAVTIETETAGECTITVPKQAVGTVEYVNETRSGVVGIKIVSKATKITSSGTGNKQKACNYSIKESEEAHAGEGGKYKGEAFVSAVGGEIKWVA